MWREQAVQIARIADELHAHPRERVRTKVALARDELLVGGAPRRVDAVRAQEAERVVDRRRRNEILIRGGAEVLACVRAADAG